MKTYLSLLFTICFVALTNAQTFNLAKQLEASNITQNSEFGRAVCINGDYAIVGALLDDHNGITDGGAAFVYHFENGQWVFQAKLMSADSEAKDHFGRSVYINDNRAIVGCTYSNDPETYNGSAYIFVNNNGVWTQQAKLLASDRGRMDRFGVTVGMWGDYAIVGCYGSDYTVNGTAYSNGGAAYIYHFNGTSWGEEQKLIPNVPINEMKFGWAVSMYNDKAIIGTTEDRYNNTDLIPGSAFIFSLQGSTWVQTAKLTPADTQDGDNFGCAVNLNGDYAIVGAFEDNDHGTSSGSAYVYHYEGGAWQMQQKLSAANGVSADNYGWSVGITQNRAVVGAYHSNKDYNDTGSAYVYSRNNTTWSLDQELIAADRALADQAGWFVSVSGDNVLVGAPRWDINRSVPSIDQGTNEGQAYIYTAAVQAPQVSALTPAHLSTKISTTQAITVAFNQPVQFTTGNAQVIIGKTSDQSVVETLSITSGVAQAGITISSQTLTIAHTALQAGVGYYVQFVNNPIASATAVPFAGLSTTADWTFTTLMVAPAWVATYPAVTNITKTSIDLQLQTTQSGNYAYIITTLSTTPTVAQIKSGLNASGISTPLAGTGGPIGPQFTTWQVNTLGLQSATVYHVFMVFENQDLLSTPIAEITFAVPDKIAPTYAPNYPMVSSTNGQVADLKIQITEAGVSHYVILLANATAPSIANVNSGLNASGLPALAYGTMDLTANTEATATILSLTPLTNYTVYVATSDLANNAIELVSATVLSFSTPEQVIFPMAITSTPASQAVNVAVNQAISLIFSKNAFVVPSGVAVTNANIESLLTFEEAFQPASTGNGNPPAAISTPQPFTATYNNVTRTVSITPINGLQQKRRYQIHISSLQDADGLVVEAKDFYFTTVDALPPVAFIYPAPADYSPLINEPVFIYFDEPVKALDGHELTGGEWQLMVTLKETISSTTQSIQVVADETGKSLKITPSSSLTPNLGYTITIQPVEDVDGNEQLVASTLTFATAKYNTWTGLGVVSNLTDPANWQAAYVAGAGIIVPSTTPTLLINSTVTTPSLTINPLASVTVQSAGILTVQKELVIKSSSLGSGSFINKGTLSVDPQNVHISYPIAQTNLWQFVSIPVTNGLLPANATGNAFTYNNATGQYVPFDNVTSQNSMLGFLVRNVQDLSFSGELNNGTQSIAVSNSANGYGWNLVGNPFAASIDWDMVASNQKNNVADGFWILRDNGLYGTYNGLTHAGVNVGVNPSQIPSMHAFWVKANGAGWLTVDNQALVHNTQTYLKAAAAEGTLIRLTAISNAIKDETLIAFSPLATNSFDGYDSEKRFGSNADAIELYSITDNKQVAINGLTEPMENMTIDLGYRTSKAGRYSIQLSDIQTGTTPFAVQLIDNELNQTVDLAKGDAYSFDSEAVNATSRFTIKIVNPVATGINAARGTKSNTVYGVNNAIVVKYVASENAVVSVFDLSGKLVTTKTLLSNSGFNTIAIEKSGVYILEIKSQQQLENYKVFVNNN